MFLPQSNFIFMQQPCQDAASFVAGAGDASAAVTSCQESKGLSLSSGDQSTNSKILQLLEQLLPMVRSLSTSVRWLKELQYQHDKETISQSDQSESEDTANSPSPRHRSRAGSDGSLYATTTTTMQPQLGLMSGTPQSLSLKDGKTSLPPTLSDSQSLLTKPSISINESPVSLQPQQPSMAVPSRGSNVSREDLTNIISELMQETTRPAPYSSWQSRTKSTRPPPLDSRHYRASDTRMRRPYYTSGNSYAKPRGYERY